MASNISGYFSQTAATKAAEELSKHGYTFAPLPGSLLDPFVAIAPDERHYHIIFEEVALNEWSSAYTISRRAKLPRRILNAMSNADA